MQIKIFNIPIPGGEEMNEEMNLFLRQKRIVQIAEQVVERGGGGAFWSFCIKYLDDPTVADRTKTKVDYREILDEAAFKKFSALREIRKKVATDDAVPAYAVFTDEELAEVAKLPEITTAAMKNIRGIGEKKVEKYGQHFIQKQEPR